MSTMAPLLAADVGDLIQVVLIILFIVVPIVWGALNKFSQKQPQQRPGGRRPAGGAPRGAAAGGAPGGAAAGGAPGGGLEDEIGEFLRRAARQRQGRAGPAAQPAAAQPAGQQLVEAQVVSQPAIGEGIREHVGEHLDAGKFQRRAGELGGEVAQADEQIEQRLRAKFDHKVGRLAGRRGETADAPKVTQPTEPEDVPAELPSTAAAGLAAMLSNSVGIRQAIVINEILTRPESRWT